MDMDTIVERNRELRRSGRAEGFIVGVAMCLIAYGVGYFIG